MLRCVASMLTKTFLKCFPAMASCRHCGHACQNLVDRCQILISALTCCARPKYPGSSLCRLVVLPAPSHSSSPPFSSSSLTVSCTSFTCSHPLFSREASQGRKSRRSHPRSMNGTGASTNQNSQSCRRYRGYASHYTSYQCPQTASDAGANTCTRSATLKGAILHCCTTQSGTLSQRVEIGNVKRNTYSVVLS